jgi:cysteinyl-tRNA synthetase
MKLYNTETRKVEELIPLQQGEVKMYCCGPTLYDYAHIGNFRPYIWQDVLRKTIQHAGYKLTHVMNITDVGHLTSDEDTGEDKMMVAARRVKGSVATFQDVIDIARFYEMDKVLGLLWS